MSYNPRQGISEELPFTIWSDKVAKSLDMVAAKWNYSCRRNKPWKVPWGTHLTLAQLNRKDTMSLATEAVLAAS